MPISLPIHLKGMGLISWAQFHPLCRITDLGSTVNGRDLNLLIIGDQKPEKAKVWIIARQHPGESMAEWFMEGLIKRLLDSSDALSKSLINQATFYLVPNMNPDGSIRGNLRSNSAGANLNREWDESDNGIQSRSLFGKRKNFSDRCKYFLGSHGDEALPYNFVARCEGN